MYSFIVNSISPHKIFKLEENLKKVMHSVAWELICINDAKSMCEGYNRGMALAKGTFLIFCHDDIEFIAEDITISLELAFPMYYNGQASDFYTFYNFKVESKVSIFY